MKTDEEELFEICARAAHDPVAQSFILEHAASALR